MRKFILLSSLFAVLALFSAPGSQAAEKRALIFTKNGKGFVHDNIATSAAALTKLCQENGIASDVSDKPEVFTDENLKRYQVVIFTNTNNETVDTEEQKVAFKRFIQAGGGFVGIHSAIGSERQWPWYWDLIGGKFAWHPKLQLFTIKVKDHNHPSTAFLGETWQWTDEFYFTDHAPADLHILLMGDMTTLKLDEKQLEKEPAKGHTEFPLAWYHTFDGGRSWYTALGHKKDHYSDPTFLKHLLGGIQWAMGDSKATAAPVQK